MRRTSAAKPDPADRPGNHGSVDHVLAGMPRCPALLGLPLILFVAACAGTGTGAAQPESPATTKAPNGAFERRAAEMATAWTAALGRTKWNDGFLPLQDLTVLP